jgi:hypothetical protein
MEGAKSVQKLLLVITLFVAPFKSYALTNQDLQKSQIKTSQTPTPLMPAPAMQIAASNCNAHSREPLTPFEKSPFEICELARVNATFECNQLSGDNSDFRRNATAFFLSQSCVRYSEPIYKSACEEGVRIAKNDSPQCRTLKPYSPSYWGRLFPPQRSNQFLRAMKGLSLPKSLKLS